MKATETFAAFLPKFHKYTTYLKLNNVIIVEELTEKVTPRLQRAITTNTMEFNTIKGLGDYCQRVDNQLCNIDSTHKREKESVKRAVALPTSSSKVP